jgi:hypothetical protein
MRWGSGGVLVLGCEQRRGKTMRREEAGGRQTIQREWQRKWTYSSHDERHPEVQDMQREKTDHGEGVVTQGLLPR